MSEVLLIFPPIWDLFSPYTSIPALSAFLKMKGIKVSVWDANVEIHDIMISDGYLRSCLQNLEGCARRFGSGSPEYLEILQKIELGQMMLGQVDALKEELRSAGNDRTGMLRGKNMLENMKTIIPITGRWPRPEQSAVTLSALRESADHVMENIFYPLLKQGVTEKLRQFSGKLVGISVAGAGQLANAFVIARLIKECRPDIRVAMGGAMLPYLKSALLGEEKYPELDFVVTGEGETALFRLLEACDSGDFAAVPNLIYGERYRASETETREDVDELPVLDYSDMPLDRYFLPQGLLAYLTARGCYWNRCVFCSLACNFGHRYLARDLDRVIEDLRHFRHRYGAKYIAFHDESIPPRRLLSLSEKILESGLDIKWFALLRLEDGFSRRHFECAYRAGLRMASFGIESGDQETLDRMRKGINLASMSRVLKESHDAGIWNNTFAIADFPGEGHVERTIAFIQGHAAYIDSLCYTLLRLEGHSYAHLHPEEFGLVREATPKDYFGPAFPYHSKSPQGLSPYARFRQEFQGFHFQMEEFFGYDDHRILIHVAEQGKDAVRRANQENIRSAATVRNMLLEGRDFFLHLDPEVLVRREGISMAYHRVYHHAVFNEVVCAILYEAREPILVSELVRRLLAEFQVDAGVLEGDLQKLLPKLSVLRFLNSSAAHRS